MSEYDTILVELIKKGMSIQRKVMNSIPFKWHNFQLTNTAGTVSMGWDTMLYVCQPIDAQVTFINQVVTQLLSGEKIGQDTMPGQEGATYVETDETE